MIKSNNSWLLNGMIQHKSTIGYYKANDISAPDEAYDASDCEFKIFLLT